MNNWFWNRLEQAERDFAELPPWMRVETRPDAEDDPLDLNRRGDVITAGPTVDQEGR